MSEILDGHEDEEEGTRKTLLQATRDFSWATYNASKETNDVLPPVCTGAVTFQRTDIIEVAGMETNKDGTLDLALEWDKHCFNVPRQYVLLEDEFMG